MSLVDPLADLGIATTKTSKKKKKDSAELVDSSLDYSVKEFIEAVKTIKDAESRKERAAARIIPRAEEARMKACESGGIITSTLVNGKVRVTSKDQYSDVGAENKKLLEQTFGSDINEYIEAKTEIKLKSDLNSIQKLIEYLGGQDLDLGKKRLFEMFDIKQKYVVKTAFYNKYSSSEEFRDKVQTLVDDAVIKQHKPTVVEA